jgi:hypothetical protein
MMKALALLMVVGSFSGVAAYIQMCNGQQGQYVYAWLEYPNQGGFQVVKLDAKHGCVNQTLLSFRGSQYSIAEYSQSACSGDGRYIGLLTRLSGQNEYLLYDTVTGQSRAENRGVGVAKYAWNDKTNLPILIYQVGSGRFRIGSTAGFHGNNGHIYTDFSTPNGVTNVQGIAAFHQQEQKWHINFQTPHSDTSYMTTVTLDGEVSYFEHTHRIFDMYYNRTSHGVVMVYSTTGWEDSCNGLPESSPTNPRAHTIYFANVLNNTIHNFKTVTVRDCLRWHAISTNTNDRYYFYTQQDYGSASNQYNNGVGYADFSMGGNTVQGFLSPYWGGGVDSALWGMCPFIENDG